MHCRTHTPCLQIEGKILLVRVIAIIRVSKMLLVQVKMSGVYIAVTSIRYKTFDPWVFFSRYKMYIAQLY